MGFKFAWHVTGGAWLPPVDQWAPQAILPASALRHPSSSISYIQSKPCRAACTEVGCRPQALPGNGPSLSGAAQPPQQRTTHGAAVQQSSARQHRDVGEAAGALLSMRCIRVRPCSRNIKGKRTRRSGTHIVVGEHGGDGVDPAAERLAQDEDVRAHAVVFARQQPPRARQARLHLFRHARETVMSGRTPSCSHASSRPVRARPVCTCLGIYNEMSCLDWHQHSLRPVAPLFLLKKRRHLP